MLQHSLNNAAAVGMCTEFLHSSMESVDNELYMFSWNPFDGLLYHMVTILVLDASMDIVLKLSDKSRLLVGQYVFKSLKIIRESNDSPGTVTNYLLHDSTTIHLRR